MNKWNYDMDMELDYVDRETAPLELECVSVSLTRIRFVPSQRTLEQTDRRRIECGKEVDFGYFNSHIDQI